MLSTTTSTRARSPGSGSAPGRLPGRRRPPLPREPPSGPAPSRSPAGLPVAGDVELGEAEIEIELYAERAVLEKQLVAAERVRIERDVRREAASVEDELRVDRAADDYV